MVFHDAGIHESEIEKQPDGTYTQHDYDTRRHTRKIDTLAN